MESNLATTPAKLPCWLNTRIFTWYTTASCRSVTLLNGVPYCGGSASTTIGGGNTSSPEPCVFLQLMLTTTNMKNKNAFIDLFLNIYSSSANYLGLLN